MGGAAASASEVMMQDNRCAFCGTAGLEPTTTTWEHGMDGVTVTIQGIPADHCPTCGETGVRGKIGIPIDAAISQILIATGVAAPPDPEIDEQLRQENRELARRLGQEDTFLDEPV